MYEPSMLIVTFGNVNRAVVEFTILTSGSVRYTTLLERKYILRELQSDVLQSDVNVQLTSILSPSSKRYELKIITKSTNNIRPTDSTIYATIGIHIKPGGLVVGCPSTQMNDLGVKASSLCYVTLDDRSVILRTPWYSSSYL